MIATLVIAFMHSAIAGCAMGGPDSPGFIGLGEGFKEAFAVSPDGSFVLGNKYEVGAVMWSDETGVQPMPWLPGAISSDASYSVTDGGSFAIGNQWLSATERSGVLWNRNNGSVLALANLPGGTNWTSASDMTASGDLIVGGNNDSVPLVWSNGVPALLHPTLKGAALGVSADGNIIVGQGLVPPANKLKRAFIRYSQGTVQFLGTLGSGCCEGSSAKAVATGCDLTVVGGTETDVPGLGYSAFRWTASNNQMVGLGVLPGADASNATDVSANGQVVIGYCWYNITDERRAFLWTPELNMVSLKDHLLSLGVTEVEGWTLYEAWSVSSDGTRIVGHGRNPQGSFEGFLAVLPNTPICFADCDGCGGLSISDFICFQTLFAVGDPDADCDESGTLSIDDFICFQTLFAVGC